MKSKILQHIIGWLLFIGYDYIDYFTGDDVSFSNTLVIVTYDLILIGVFYTIYSYLAPWLFKQFSFLKATFVVIVGVVSFIIVRYLIQEVSFDYFFGFKNYVSDSFWYFALDNLWRGFMAVVAGAFIYLVERRIQNEKMQLQLRQEKTEAELSNLRSQINPHFLFNTLSFLHAEAYVVDPQLADTILKLSDVLRHAMDSSSAKTLPISDEVNLLKNYIGIFEKRFEGKCFVDFKYENNGNDLLIEPLLLLPFVENAFKHGVVSNKDNPLQINLKVNVDKLIFRCQNKINNHQKDPGSGIGIENVKKRLSLLYPDKYDLQLNENDDTFEVKLELKL